MPLVLEAFRRGQAEVRIPPGDYRFGQERYIGNRATSPSVSRTCNATRSIRS